MFAWILNTKPLKPGSAGSTIPIVDSRAGEDGLVAERMPCLVEQHDVVEEALLRLRSQQHAERRIVERRDGRLGARRAVILAALEAIDQPTPAVVHADELPVGVDRPRDGMTVEPQIGFDVAHELEWILADAVALVDDGEDRHAAPLAHCEELPRPLLDPLAVVEQHDGAVGRDEDAVGVLGEILVARRVEQVHLESLVGELHDTGRDGDAALLLHLHPVGGRVALLPARLHGPGEMDRPTVEQKLLGEGRLPRVGVTDDGEGAAGLDGRRKR
jgi:hypothetical protein